MGWNKSLPTTGTRIVTTAIFYHDNWDALDTLFDVQHYSFAEASSGFHRAGKIGTLFTDTEANIAAITAAGTGAIAWVKDHGLLQIFGAGSWRQTPSYIPESHVVAHMASSQSITGDSSFTLYQIQFNTEDTDKVSEYNTSTYTFTCSSRGVYEINVNATLLNDSWGADKEIRLTITATGSTSAQTLCANMHTMGYTAVGSADAYSKPVYNIQVGGLLPLSAADVVRIYIATDGTITLTGASSIGKTIMVIKKVA